MVFTEGAGTGNSARGNHLWRAEVPHQGSLFSTPRGWSGRITPSIFLPGTFFGPVSVVRHRVSAMNRKLAIAGSSLVVILLAAAGVGWWLGLFSEPEAEVSLDAAVAGAVGDEEPGTDAASADTESAADSEAASTDETDELSGTWAIVPSQATFVGYRIQEVLSGVGDFTAVGRSPAVTGELVIETMGDGAVIQSVSVIADLTQLESDNGRRDSEMGRQGLETDTFPEGSFELTEPIDLGSIPAQGETIGAVAVGDFTLHGVTNRIEMPIEGQIVTDATSGADSLVIIGSSEIAMGDYDIEPPKAPVVASVEEIGVMELSLVFERR